MHVSEPLKRISPVLIALPIVCFTGLLLNYAVNVPWMDDVESFIGFMLTYLKTDQLSDKIYWLFKPNNEHRILFAKLATVGMHSLTGEVNFRGLIFIAFGCLLGLLFYFFRIFQSLRLPLLAFLPVPLLLLQPQFHLTSNWAITALQHEAAAFLVFSSLYLLAEQTSKRFGGALLVQLLASFSMSNGLFGWVAGAGVLLVQREFKKLAFWLGIGAAAIFFYFHDFANPQGNESSIGFFLKNPHLVFFGFFTFLGGQFDFFPEAEIFRRSILPTLAGFALLPTLLFLLWKMLWPWPKSVLHAPIDLAKRRYFFVGGYGFLLVNAVVVAFLRPRFGYSVMLISNYMLYPSLLVCLIYLNLLSEAKNSKWLKRYVWGGIGIGTLVWGVMYFWHLPALAERKQRIEAFAFNQKHNGNGLGAMVGTTYGTFMKQWMEGAVSQGFYRYPDNMFTSSAEKALLAPIPTKLDKNLQFKVEEQGDSFWVSSFDGPVVRGSQRACVIVKSAAHTYLFPIITQFRPRPFYLNGPASGLAAEVLKSALYPGTYQVGLYIAPDPSGIVYSSQQITIP